MFPLRDHNPSGGRPYVTFGLIGLNVAIFLAMTGLGDDPGRIAQVYYDWGLVPARGDIGGYLTSQFLHGGVVHLAGNMLFLWIFGDNVEEQLGHLRFLCFYLISGVAAGLAQMVPDPSSTIPMIGASGAIGGVMGAYLLLFPRARVDVLIIILVFIRIIPVPAWVVLGVWLAIQVGSGASLPTDEGGVAYWAHVGGFAAGALMAVPVWLARGGPAFWARTQGAPPHPEATYSRSSIPRAGRRR